EDSGPAVDIAADQVGIFPFQLDRAPDGTRQNAFAKSRRKTLHLRLDARQHVEITSIRHVAVTPGGVLAGRGARGIEQTVLRQQHERLLRMLSPPRGAL